MLYEYLTQTYEYNKNYTYIINKIQENIKKLCNLHFYDCIKYVFIFFKLIDKKEEKKYISKITKNIFYSNR